MERLPPAILFFKMPRYNLPFFLMEMAERIVITSMPRGTMEILILILEIMVLGEEFQGH